jgi:hypothetical protein
LIFSSHTVSLDVDAVCVKDDPVENSIRDCGLTVHVMPARDRQLRGDDGRATLIAFLEKLKQIEALLIRKPMGAPVVENEELDAGQFVDQLWEPPIKGNAPAGAV